MQSRPLSFYILAGLFALFVLFLYAPMLCVYILSFQGPTGGMSFPMQGFSFDWYLALFQGGARGTGDMGNAFMRSLRLAALVGVSTMLIGVAAGMAYRRKFPGSNAVFYTAIGSMIVPGIFVGFPISFCLNFIGVRPVWRHSGVGAQLTWTLPFALLIMFIVLGRFNPAYEEAATDLGANARQRFQFVILPIILPGVIGVVSAGPTPRRQEAARAGINVGAGNTMPMELTQLLGAATTPVMFAVGTLTTLVMFAIVIGTLLIAGWMARSRQLRLAQSTAG